MINSNIFSPFVSPSERNTIKKKPSRKAAALQNTPLRKRTQLLPHKSHIHLLTFTCRGDLNARPTQNATITSQNPIKARRHATPRVFRVHPQVHWVPRGGEGAAPGGWSGGQRGRECVCARQIDPGRSLRLRASAPAPPRWGPHLMHACCTTCPEYPFPPAYLIASPLYLGYRSVGCNWFNWIWTCSNLLFGFVAGLFDKYKWGV